MNRIQNESIISECRENGNSKNWECKQIFSQSQSNGWIEIAPPPIYNDNVFLQILPSLQEDDRHYKHIAKIDPVKKDCK